MDVIDERRDRLQEAWQVLNDAKSSLCGIMSCEYNRGLPYSDGHTYNNGAYEITFTNGKKVTFDVILPDDLHKYKDRDGSPICCITWIQEETFPGTNATRFHFTIDHDHSKDIVPSFYDCYFEKVGGSNYGTGAIPPKYQIWYTTSDEKVIDVFTPQYEEHGINFITNIYYGDNLYLDHKKGIIAFDQDIEILYEGVFHSNNITSIILPDNIETIMGQAFAFCSNLSAIYCPCLLPPSMHEEALWGVADNIQLYVPMASVEFYKTAAGWSAYADAIVGYDFEKGVDITPAVPNSEIWYTSTDGKIVEPYWTIDNQGDSVFGANIVSNTYTNGKGVIKFDSNVTSIGREAFRDCKSLASITIPERVTSIGHSAFWDCSSLESVTIPESVTSIGVQAFNYCSSLPIENNIRYADTYLVEAVDKTLSSYIIKEGTKFIGYSAFANCSNLVSIDIPEGVTYIEHMAFSRCSSLESVTIPEGVTYIGVEVFADCTSLVSIVIPDSVEVIGSSAFASCYSLENAIIGSGVEYIGYGLFYCCYDLAYVFCNSTIPPTLENGSNGSGTFNPSLPQMIYVPAGSEEAYRTADGWSDYADIIGVYAPEKYSSWIGEYTLFGQGTTYDIEAGSYVETEVEFTITIEAKDDAELSYYVYGWGGYSYPITAYFLAEDRLILSAGVVAENFKFGNGDVGDIYWVGQLQTNSTQTVGGIVALSKQNNQAIGMNGVLSTTFAALIDNQFYLMGADDIYMPLTLTPAATTSNNASDRKIYVPMENIEAYKTAKGWSEYADSIVGYDF